jgi:hypothetical protein
MREEELEGGADREVLRGEEERRLLAREESKTLKLNDSTSPWRSSLGMSS